MKTFVGIVASSQRATTALTAAEALRRAAASPSVSNPALTLWLEIRNTTLGRVGGLADGQITDAEAVLFVGEQSDDEVPDAARFAGKPLYRITLEQAIRAPEDALRALQALAPASASSTPSAKVGANRAVKPAAAAAAPAAGTSVDAPNVLKIVAITSCPTGIAHTFMAAEGLAQGARQLGHQIHVETQGSVGAQNRLTEAQIADADLVVIAADTQVDKSRFGGKRLYETGTKGAIGKGADLLRRAIDEATVLDGGADVAGSAGASGEANAATGGAAQGNAGGSGSAVRHASAKPAAGRVASSASGVSASSNVYRHLMTGVSFMLPFVVAGGLLIALSFAFGGIYAYDDAHKGTLAWALFQIGGKAAFALIVPVLSGYIAYSIADRPGIAPGMVGGMLAAASGAGFLGGIVSGFLAGYIALLISRKLPLPRNLQGLKPVLIIPLLSTLAVGLLMIYVVSTPVAAVLHAMETWLRAMQTGSAVALGALLGAMMAFDMGGPVNKAAYAFSTGLIASAVYTPMAAAMAGGMTPPLGIALAAWLFRSRFTVEEREAGNAAGVLGLAFISEGAIPFVARDPFRVIPACMLGSALAGAISMGAGVELKVPHGGVFVLPIPNAVTHLGMYVVAIVAGTVVTAVAVGLFKKRLPLPIAQPS